MNRPVLLWINFTQPGRQGALPAGVEDQCVLHHATGDGDIDARIRQVKPDAICFEYDYPDHTGLMALVETKRAHPAIPVVMLTEQSSEALAIWAFRSRVWDYLVKPVTAGEILERVATLHRLRRQPASGAMVMPAHTLPLELRRPGPVGPERAVLRAKAYVERHLDQPLSESKVAEHCNMSPSHFSRVFKKACGVGFSEHVLRTRLARAMDLLSRSGSSVGATAYDVGFQDSSYFARVFKRHVGMTPSQYQEACERKERPASMPRRSAGRGTMEKAVV